MLTNKRIIVTGVAGSLGRAVAAQAADYGAQVVGLDIVPQLTDKNIVHYQQIDLTDRSATAACINNLDNIDALVNVAGGFAMGTEASEPDDKEWQWMFRINVDTMRNATMASVPKLRATGRGSIVNIGALGAVTGLPQMSAYGCAKSSVMRLTESLAEELKNDGINVNAVLPSIIDTAANREAMPDADFSQWVTPQQLAEVICFLISERATAITGALIPVKGLT